MSPGNVPRTVVHRPIDVHVEKTSSTREITGNGAAEIPIRDPQYGGPDNGLKG
jgi:hypothetical protein